jgi:glycerol-1-phosphate dehydrogenase [NAD(P)+]
MSAASTLEPTAPSPRLTLAEALGSARETRALVIGRGVVRDTARVFQEQFPGRRAILVADPTTFRVAGQATAAALQTGGIAMAAPFIFTDQALYAEFHFVEVLEAALRAHDAIPVAVGSGTINDLVKLTSHRLSRPYLCVATAASMDGYTAFGASITFEGAQQTFDCPAPRAVVADIDILGAAPSAMTASGYADLMAKITAGADWILADALGAEPIDSRAWAIVQGGLREALADPAGARRGEASALTPLVGGLMLGGFAMQWLKSSRPASGAEHQFSHLWDMEHHTHQGVAPSHGFKVGVATLAVTRLYEQLLAFPMAKLDVDACVARWPEAAATEMEIQRIFAGSGFTATALKETHAKHISPAALHAQLQRLREVWPQLQARLRDQLMPSAELECRLNAVGAPTTPEAIGLTRDRLRDSFVRAHHIRRRFTVLDVARRTGLLDRLLAGLFGPGAVWDLNTPASRPPAA